MSAEKTRAKRQTTHPMRTRRQNTARASQAERNPLSPGQQLDRLDRRLGVGVGAGRERARLTGQIERES